MEENKVLIQTLALHTKARVGLQSRSIECLQSYGEQRGMTIEFGQWHLSFISRDE